MNIFNFNRHIEYDQIRTIDSNCFCVQKTDMSTFGKAPKFHMHRDFAYVIKYIPKDGIISWLLQKFRFFQPSVTLQSVYLYEGDAEWQSLIQDKLKCCWKIYGTRISLNRTDVVFCTCTLHKGGKDFQYPYKAYIKAHVEPSIFYDYLLVTKESEKRILDEIGISLEEIIKSKLNDSFGRPDFTYRGPLQIESSQLQHMGYFIDEIDLNYNKS